MGHLLLEISRFKNFLLDRGATITVTLSSMHYRRLPLELGGLEIPCAANAKLICTKKIKKSLQSIWKWLKLIIQKHHLMKMVTSVNEHANTANRKDCIKCPNKRKKKQIIEKSNNT